MRVYSEDNYPTKKKAAASSMVQVTVLPSSVIITSWPHHPLLIRQSAQDRGRVMAISAGGAALTLLSLSTAIW